MKAFFFTIFLLAVLGVCFVVSGVYDIGADTPHSRPTFALLQFLRERSIQTRLNGMTKPDLDDAARIRQGAGNYDAMPAKMKSGFAACNAARAGPSPTHT